MDKLDPHSSECKSALPSDLDPFDSDISLELFKEKKANDATVEENASAMVPNVETGASSPALGSDVESSSSQISSVKNNDSCNKASAVDFTLPLSSPIEEDFQIKETSEERGNDKELFETDESLRSSSENVKSTSEKSDSSENETS